MAPFEKQFDKQPPTRIGVVYLGTNETAAVFIDDGWVTVPIYPPDPEDTEDEDNPTPTEDIPDEINPFLLYLTPTEARDLAGLLTYAAGRANETTLHCADCGAPTDNDDEEE